MNDITVIIPTSPIPSHPSTEILDETIANIRKYTLAPIIIMADGVHESLAHRTGDYEQYKMNILDRLGEFKYGECVLQTFTHHTHQAMMTSQVLADVKTPLVLFCEHDTSPIGNIPFDSICTVVRRKGDINYVRFNIFHEILSEHQYLMIDKKPQLYGNDIPLVRTLQWSQRPHIAKVNWYRDLLFTYMHEKKTMIEDVMHSVVPTKYHALGFDTFGLAVYTPEGNQLRSYHSDGRKDDEKIIDG